MKKILTFIPSYGTNNSNYLKLILEELNSIDTHNIDIILYTTEDYDFITDNVDVRKYNKDIKIGLTHEYKLDLLNSIDNYDIFLYLEDDILFTHKNLITFENENKYLPDDYVIGLLRYEEYNGKKYLNEMCKNSDQHSSIPIVGQTDDRYYFSIENVHQGSFILERRNIKQLIDNDNFIINFGESLEAAASNFYKGKWPGNSNGLNKIYPFDSIDDLMVHHLPNKHCKWESLNLTTLEELKGMIV
jgi:hypothetical protein